MVKVDNRSKEKIVAEMIERSKSYTPEWNMDPGSPDIASVLALACADMFAGTLKKVNGIPLKNKIAFYNMTNAGLLPAAPSEGYVSFSLAADDVGSTQVEKGAVLSSYASDGDTMHFETCDDILVSPARIVKLFCADDSEDYIGEYADFETEKTALFSLLPANLQRHVLRISHPFAFDIRTRGQICLRFFRNGGTAVSPEVICALADPEVADIEYYAGEETGFVRFPHVKELGGDLLLMKNESMPAFAPPAEDGCCVRVTLKNTAALEPFSFTRLEAAPTGKTILPDCVTDGNVEYDLNGFYPFGERFQLFNEVYFCCDEALNKRGAKITLNFDMRFMQIPIEDPMEDIEINWKWIANKKDFQEAKAYKIGITGVIWEYFNGSGWSRLFPDDAYTDHFSVIQGVLACFKTMSFICPADMSETFVGARTGFFIRARILKAANMYKTRGWYLSPQLSNVSFDYCYEGDGCRVTDLVSCNNLEEQRFDPASEAGYEGFVPFRGTGDAGRTVYFGFSAPPEKGPLCILWDVEEDPSAARAKLEWKYLSAGGWKPMSMADETAGFTKVGLTVFLDNHDFQQARLFGETLYWVAVTDADNAFGRKLRRIPIVNRIIHNSVRAVNVDSHNEEYFAMSVYGENAEFQLAAERILDFALYVNEFSTVTDEEAAALEREGRVLRVRSGGGLDTEIWVRWNEVNSFITEDGNSRCYLIDRSTGRFSFGDGRKGRIPSVSDVNNIRVVYTTGGGERTNVEAGGVKSLERSYGFISGVTNPKRFYGGRDAETIHEAMKRSAVMLRTQGKVVTARDLESLTFNASRSIRKLRCVTGRNAAGDRAPGTVTLVVLKHENSEFGRIRSDILRYLRHRLPGNIVSAENLCITEPTFVKVNVRTEIKTDKVNGIFELKKNVERCLADYFASFSGPDGDNVWQLDALPNEQQIRSALLRLKNVVYIRSMYITMYVSGAGGPREIDADSISRYSYILPRNGEHDISVIVDRQG